MKLIRLGLSVWILLLCACGTPHRAPVADIEGGPRYLHDGRQHRVNAGETLYSIAWMYDLNYLLLAQVNNISPPYIIYTGQQLSVDLRGHSLNRSSSSGSVPRATPARSNPAVVSTPLPGDSQSTPPPSAPARAQPSTAQPVGNKVSGTGPVTWAWPAGGRLLARFSASGTENKGIDIAGNAGDPVRAASDGEVVYAGSGLLRYGEMIILKHNDRFLSAYAHNQQLLVKEGERVARGQQIAELGSTGIDRTMLHFEIRDSGRPVDPLGFLPSR